MPAPVPRPVPLIDLAPDTYKGFEGGLYPGGQNTPPEPYLAAALRRSREIQPRGPDGAPDPERGLIGFLSVGPSTTVHQFAAFERLEDPSPERNPRVVLLNGAQIAQIATKIADPDSDYWPLVLDRVAAAGLTPAQVQVVWFNQLALRVLPEPPAGVTDSRQRKRLRRLALEDPATDFPGHALELRDELDAIVEILGRLFENLELCYLSDNAYGGHGEPNTRFSEPHTFEGGFAVKWLIAERIEAPKTWLNESPLPLWGPYFWADGARPSSAGTHWEPEDFEREIEGHPSVSGEDKVARLLQDFFHSDPTAAGWYLRDPAVESAPVRVVDADRDASISRLQPKRNFGQSQQLQLGAGQRDQAFLHFDLSQVRRPVLHAKLSLRNPTENGAFLTWDVHRADGPWDELELCAANAPPLGPVLGSLPPSSRDGTRSLDLTEAINALEQPSLSLAIVSRKRDLGLAAVLSRESPHPPRLILVEASAEPKGTSRAR